MELYANDGTRSVPTTWVPATLARQELDDDVHIDREAEVAGTGNADHRGPQRFRIERNPVGRLLVVALADDALVQAVNRFLRPDRDHIAGPQLVAGAGDLDAVDVEVAVNDALAGLRTGLGVARPADDIVQSPLAE